MGIKAKSGYHYVLFLFITSFLFVLCLSGSAFAKDNPSYPKFLRYAALSPGTLLYAVNSGLAKVASDNSPMKVMVIPTSGGSAYLPMLSKLGSADLATDNFSTFWQMWTGKPAPEPIPKGFPPKPPYPETKNIRILIAGPAARVGMLARKDSGLKDVSDLKGKKVSWEWSAFPANIAITLANLFNGGLTLDDIKPVPMTEVVAGVKAVQEGRVDASAAAVGMGAIAEADSLVGVRFLRNSMDPERIKAGQRANPGCYASVQPGGAPGVPEDTPLWSLPIGILVSTRMADHVAYKLVETWWKHHKEYAPIHPLLRMWTPNTYTNPHFTIPYHNGAVQFLKEMDVWTPEMEEKQRLLSK